MICQFCRGDLIKHTGHRSWCPVIKSYREGTPLNENIMAVPLAGNIKIDQLAFCSWGDEDDRNIKKFLKLSDAEWVEDTVIARGQVGTREGITNQANLQFNYDLGHEVEILRYTSGANYLLLAGVPGGRMCHVGSHFIGDGDVPRVDAPIIQRLTTLSHTNPYQASHKRHYRYTIYDTYSRLGLFFKIIERLAVPNG